jgi:small subunit ribosomal protein S20
MYGFLDHLHLMPNHASAKKRLRRDSKKRVANKSAISALRTFLKKIKKGECTPENIQSAQKALDTAASKGVIHRNSAARQTSILMKSVAGSASKV